MSSWKHVREKTIYSAENFNSEIMQANTSVKHNSYVLNDEEVVMFVVGLPRQMNNLPSESEQFIKSFIRNLKRTFPEIPIKREDERFTSKMALQSMIDSGIKKKQRSNKAMVNEISATLILQSYLNRK